MRRLSSDVSDRDICCGSASGEKWYTYPAGVEGIVNPLLRFPVIHIQQRNIMPFYYHLASKRMSDSPDEMLPPMEPLQRLPQQPLISPTGARLVLCNDDIGYPDHTDPSLPGMGRWFDNIASTDTKTFLQASNKFVNYPIYPAYPLSWVWPAVVLTPEEYTLRVGGMSVAELRSQLEKYWGRGGIPGAAVDDDYQDMWVPAWAPENTDDPYELSWDFRGMIDEGEKTTPLDPTIFSHWVNRECSKWLSYFIVKNHTFGVVHAWFSAFLGVTRESLYWMARFPTGDSGIQHLKFRMSFDLCIKDYDEVVDGIPSLPFDTKITTQRGMQVISETIDKMYPRRVWDICANTIIPATWFCSPPCPLTKRCMVPLGVKPISHAWVADGDLTYIMTEANQSMWPIPLPRGVQLEDIRGEMIRLGVRYAWLDVLCLRQELRPALTKDLPIPVSREVIKCREQRRLKEWEVDVPTIGEIYSDLEMYSIYRRGPIVIFMSGLGRPFRDEGWASERHWLRRAWTIQETPVLSQCLIAGLPGGVNYKWKDGVSGSDWPWNCKVCNMLSQIYNIHIVSFQE